jgi:hypothetical protein
VFVKGSVRSCSQRVTGHRVANLLGIYDREEGLKVLAFDFTQGYNGAKGFVIADSKLGEFGGKIDRVASEKVSVNAKQRAINLLPLSVGQPVAHHKSILRTKNVMFPSLKKYVSCRGNESSVVRLVAAEIPARPAASASSPPACVTGTSVVA